MALHHETLERTATERDHPLLLVRWRWLVYLALLASAVALARLADSHGSTPSPWTGDPTTNSR